MKRAIEFAVVLSLASAVGAAHASIVPIGPFTGDFQEGFESGQADGVFIPQIDVFGGEGIVRTITGAGGVHTTAGWNSLTPRSGVRLMGIGAGGGSSWEFNTPVQRFGGYMSSIFSTSGGVARFYDTQNNLVDVLPISMTMDVWTWNGWEATGGVLINRIELVNNEFGGVFIMFDDMELTFVPAPSAIALLGLAGLMAHRRRRQ